ncbi:MAG TPA: hypothetical protein ENJ87_04450 [Gammaproteobacteria bacterium]|nr:hypothetical protein [Gammaproteobacteria bacterium]
MAILSGIPVLHCRTIEATLDFYQQKLQFVMVKKRESEGRLQWAHLMNASTTLMLQRTEVSLPDQQQENISLYFFVSNIKEMRHIFKVKYGIDTCLATTPYHMHECDVQDPEGNRITLGQKLEPEK